MSKIHGCIQFFLLSALTAFSAEDLLMEGVLSPVDPQILADVGESPQPTLTEVMTTAPAETVPLSETALYDLVLALESSLVERLGLPGRLELTPTAGLPQIRVGEDPLDLNLIEHPQRLSGSGVVLRYEVLRSGEPVGEWRGVFRCRHLAEVWVPVRRMNAGGVLLPEDFETREVDLIRNAKAVVADPLELSRYELARSVYSGRPISWTDLAPRALVRKGELVDVVVREGFLSISMKALAVSTGSLGEVVAVRNLESKRDFPAEVVDEKTVQVSF